jgi:hypothetical protein
VLGTGTGTIISIHLSFHHYPIAGFFAILTGELHMTIESTESKIQYLGNGAGTSFPIPFPFGREANVKVVRTDPQGADELLDSNYEVQRISQSAARVVYPLSGPPLPSGWKLTIFRKTPLNQETDLENGGNFNAEVIESTFDREEMQIQELQEQVERCIIVPISSDGPPPTARELLDGVNNARDEAQAAAAASGESASQAGASAAQAGESASEAEDWSELSRKWAENPEDVVVADGGYSSLHWAKKAATSAATAEAIKQEIEAVQGVVTYLDGHDFGDPADDPDWQQTLTDYALGQVPEWETVPNSCDVVNLWDGHEWIYNIETERWIDWGLATVAPATPETAGVVRADTAATPGTVVLRDENRRAQISAPVGAGDIANKGYVDGHGRKHFYSNLDVYIRVDGNDANSGMEDSPEGAWATPDGLTAFLNNCDMHGNSITAHFGPGDFPYLFVSSGLANCRRLMIEGAGTEATRFIGDSTHAGILVLESGDKTVTLNNMEVVANGSNGIIVGNNSSIWISAVAVTGTGTSAIVTHNNSFVMFTGHTLIKIGGQWMYIIRANHLSFIRAESEFTINILPNTTVSGAVAFAEERGLHNFSYISFSGSTPTGKRYSVTGGAFIDSNGGGANFIPGTIAGTTATGGSYV